MDVMELRRGLLMAMAQGGLPVGIKAIKTGTLTIESDSIDIVVQTNLGSKPDFAAIWIDDLDASLIPYGSCVKTVYNRFQYVNGGDSLNTPSYDMLYFYKHSTSGNIIFSSYNPNNDNAGSTNEFTFTRGTVPWKAVDVNGNSIVYRWVALTLE